MQERGGGGGGVRAFMKIEFDERKVLGLEPKVELLDYLDAFPHSIEISKSSGSGVINFESIRCLCC